MMDNTESCQRHADVVNGEHELGRCLGPPSYRPYLMHNNYPSLYYYIILLLSTFSRISPANQFEKNLQEVDDFDIGLTAALLCSAQIEIANPTQRPNRCCGEDGEEQSLLE